MITVSHVATQTLVTDALHTEATANATSSETTRLATTAMTG